nr:carbohydrate sulfotransferase 11-like isoform X1 [Lytechinus pictus]
MIEGHHTWIDMSHFDEETSGNRPDISSDIVAERNPQQLPNMTVTCLRRKAFRSPFLAICTLAVGCCALYMFYGYRTFTKAPRYVHVDKLSSSPLEGNTNAYISNQILHSTVPKSKQVKEPPSFGKDIGTKDFILKFNEDNISVTNAPEHISPSKTMDSEPTNHVTASRGHQFHNRTAKLTESPTPSVEEILKLQAKRKQRIADVCHEHRLKIEGNFLYKDTFRHMYVIEEQKLLFCYIPKVGCSNWKRVLMVLDGKRDVMDDITSREAHAHNGITRFGMISKEEQEYRLQNYRKVMFVRNPLARVVSAYKNKFADLAVYRTAPPVFHKFGKRIVKRYRNNPSPLALTTGENVTFAEFVTYLTNKNERLEFDRHWKEMYKLCSPCQIHYDFIGKLENAYDEAEYVLRNMNFTRSLSFPGRENSHPTNVSSSGTDEYFENFSTETLRALWDIYHTDFELFGYPKPDYIN